MKRQQLVFWSWLNAAGLSRRASTRRWIEGRFALWKRTALRSILGQQIDDWHYVLLCRPGSARLTAPLRAQIHDERVQIIHTGPEEAEWRRGLPRAEQYVVARLDSDDRYHPSAGRLLLRAATRARRPYLQFNRGFALDEGTRRLFDWGQKSSPFYARILGPEYPEGPAIRAPNHQGVRAHATTMMQGRFMVTIHGANTSTTRSAQPIGAELPPPRARSVLRAFGIPVPAAYKKRVYSRKAWERSRR